jgi:DNA-binding IclR family transcriptional regulator
VTGSVVVIGSAASELRRRLGPLAWVVLELAVSESCDGAASVSARSIAVALGVSKDTAARAVRRLTDAGLMKRLERHGDDGRFRAGRYRLLVGADVLSTSEVRAVKVAQAAVRPTASQLPLPELG